MECECGSPSQRKFAAEMGIRSPGLKGLKKPIVFVFPELTICLNCGRAEFVVPKAERDILSTGAPAAEKS